MTRRRKMKIKTGELSGSALRWAVAQCEYGDGRQIVVLHGGHSIGVETHPGSGYQFIFRPDEDWSQGGPIIERERINIEYDSEWGAYDPTDADDNGDRWLATWYQLNMLFNCYGPTPLIAAMRCYVDSKLGGEVDVPEEVINVG
jgi:hypothetical protein